MANAIYPKWKEAMEQTGANSVLTDTVKPNPMDVRLSDPTQLRDLELPHEEERRRTRQRPRCRRR